MRRPSAAFAVAMLLAVAPALRAQTVVLDFEELACPVTALTTYQRAGYRISAVSNDPPGPAGLAYWCSGGGYGGTKALFANSILSSTLTLSRPDAAAFGISSIRLANTTANLIGGSITFTGTTSSGSTVLQQFVVRNSSPVTFETFLFDAVFRDLLSLSWTTGPWNRGCPSAPGGQCLNYGLANAQFDDLTLFATVPEPAAIPLLSAGLLIMYFRRRRLAA